MDEMRIGSKFTRGLIARILQKTIKKKLGYSVNVNLNGFQVTISDGVAHVHLDADAEMNTDELTKIIASAGF